MQTSDNFDSFFEFEQEFDKQLSPAQRRIVKLEEIRAKIKTPDNVWLSTPESRAAFRGLGPADQLYAAYGENRGFQGSELEALIDHLSPATN